MLGLVSISSLGQLVKEPYLIYTGNNETMKIMFQAEKPQVYLVSYGQTQQYEIGSAQISQLKKGKNENVFAYTFKYLKPNTKYYYRVTDKHKQNEYTGYFYSAKKPSDKKVYFTVVGATLSNQINEQLAKSITEFSEKEKKFRSIVLHTGNLVKIGNSEKSWSEVFFNRNDTNTRKLYANTSIIATKGKNEQEKCLFSKNKQLFLKYFQYPYVSTNNAYFSVKQGYVKFIVLDQFADLETNSTQFNWLSKELESDFLFQKVILIHSIKKLRNTALNTLLEKNNVKLVFTGDANGYAHYKMGNIHYFSTGNGNFLNEKNNLTAILKTVKESSFISVKYEGSDISITVFDMNLKQVDKVHIKY